MAFHTQRQRLHTLQQMKRISRRKAGAEIAQPLGPCPHDKSGRTELVGKNNAMISGVRFGQGGEFAGSPPIEPAAIDQRATDGDTVAADPFSDGMHHNVGAECKRPGQIWRGKGIVDKKRNRCRMRDLRDPRNIEHFKTGIADGLADDESGFRSDRRAKAIEIAWLDESRRNAEAWQMCG